MRIATILAVALLGTSSLAGAEHAQAAIQHYKLNIPRQSLDSALKDLAQQTGLQIGRFSGRVDGSAMVGPVLGDQTPAQALKTLLNNTGLDYKIVSETTIAVYNPKEAPSAQFDSSLYSTASGQPVPANADDANTSKEVGKRSSQDFRLAQVDQGKGSNHSSVEQRNSSSEESSKNPSVGLEEIVVTAQKRAERLLDVPISISVLSGDQLDRSTQQGVYEELNRVPGVVIPPISLNGMSQISIRGVGADAAQWDGASPVAYYLDTVPFGFVRSAFIPDSGAFDLARVEVLRGPQGTLYGANAEDGVVRVITNEADSSGFDLKARVFGSGTDGGGANGGGDLAVNVPLIPGQLAVRAVVSYKDMSGWIDRPTERNANDALLRDYRLKLAYQPTDALSIGLSLWSSRDHYGAPPTGLPNGTAPNSGTTAEPIDNNFDAYGAKISYQFAQFSVTSMTSYLDFSSYDAVDLTPYGPDSFIAFGALSILGLEKSHVLSEEFLLNSTHTDPWRWTAGVFYRDASDVNWQVTAPTALGYTNFKDTSRSYAVFGQIGRRFLDNEFEWTLGVRQFHDDVSTLSLDPAVSSYIPEAFNATTPRAVLSWYPSTTMTVYSSFSEGFRSGMPQFYTITQIDPNIAALKPDKLYNYEVGTKDDLFDHHLTIETSVYFVQWRDVQQSIGVPSPGGGYLPAQVNASTASGPGVDIGVTVRPTERLQVGGTSSWNDLTVDRPVMSNGLVLYSKGDRLNNSSEYTGSLFARYTFPLGGGNSGELSASGNYTSKQEAHSIDGNGLPFKGDGDSLFFAQAAFAVNFRTNWAIRLYGDNLTNDSHSLTYGGVIPGFAPSTEQLAPRPRPRTVGLEMNYQYK